MPVLHSVRARWHVEKFWDVVPLGRGRVFGEQERSEVVFPATGTGYVVKAVRLDVIVDDGPDGFARSFAYLLAGLKFNANAPDRGSSAPLGGYDGLTFVNAIPGSMLSTPADLDKPTMRHAITGPFAKDWPINAGQWLQLTLEYNGPPIPLAFLRMVPTGIGAEHG